MVFTAESCITVYSTVICDIFTKYFIVILSVRFSNYCRTLFELYTGNSVMNEDTSKRVCCYI